MGINFNRNQQQYSNPFRKGPIIDEVRHLRAQIKSLECFVGHCEPGGGLCAPGGVVFTDASGNLANNCAEFFWDNTNFRLGIGIPTPLANIHILSGILEDSCIIYEHFGGNIWRVGSSPVNDEFTWANGSDFNTSRRLSLTRESGIANASTLKFWEGGASSNFIGLKAPNALATDSVYTFPSGYPSGAGDVLSSDLAGNLSWTAAGGGGIFLKDAAVGNNIWSDNTTQPIGGSVDNFLAGETAGNVLNGSNNNIAIGNRAMELLAVTESMTVIGVEALKNATVAEQSVIIGYQAAEVGNNISRSVYLGALAGNSSGGDDNVAIGYGALTSATGRGGDHIIAIGDNAMGDSGSTSPGSISYTVAIGHEAGFRLGNPGNRTIADNVLIGRKTGYNIDSSVGGSLFASYITAVGARAGCYQNLLAPATPSIGVSGLTAIGSDCFPGLGTLGDAFNNIGGLTLSPSSTGIGASAGILLQRSRCNFLAGTSTASIADGMQRCTIVGEYALFNTQSATGASSASLSTRIEGLTAIGYRAVGGAANGINVGTGSVVIGSEALAGGAMGDNTAFDSVIIGEQAAFTPLTAGSGSNCILIGQGVDYTAATTQNEINIGDFYKGADTGLASAKATIEGGLTVNSTAQGLVLPRMTGAEAEAIASIDGTMIYCNNGNGLTINAIGFWGKTSGLWSPL